VSVKSPCRNPKASNDDLTLHTDLNYWHSSPSRPNFQVWIFSFIYNEVWRKTREDCVWKIVQKEEEDSFVARECTNQKW
jgi:hypothetical protein